MTMVLVGAMIVAGIETVWSGQVAPLTHEPKTVDYQRAPAGVKLAHGEEMGRFKLSFTVILLFPGNTVEWDAKFREGTATRMGGTAGHREERLIPEVSDSNYSATAVNDNRPSGV